MKKIFITAFILFGLTFYAQNNKSLLWKISGNGLKSSSYLYGTIHITCDATLDKSTLDALEKTQQLYLELDMDDPNMQTEMMSRMMMKDGKTMSSLMSAEDYKLVDDYIKEKMGYSIAMLNSMKPIMISSMLLPSLIDCPIQSAEQELMKVTKTQNEEVYGLESVADQFDVFDAIPYQVQTDEFVKSVKDKFVKDKKELDDIYAVYKTKDIEAIHKMSGESDNKITTDYQDILLNNRNNNWISKIEVISKEKPTFFGVGAAHLGGKEGVISLLRKKGYKVEPVF